MNTLRRGSIGVDVSTWQGIVGVHIDGVFGPATESATRAWQRTAGIEADGIVGPATWRAARPAPPEILKGTDLSAIQGVLSSATWRAVADAGIAFAILRAVVGNESWTDSAAAANARLAEESGIVAWPYVFAYPLPHLSPEEQAEHFVRKLEAMGRSFAEVPVALDAEWPPREERGKDGTLVYPWRKWGCSAPQLRDWIMRCLTRLEALVGRRALVYSYRYWLQCIEADLLPELAERPLWLAEYTYRGRWPTAEAVTRLVPPRPWTSILIVQHDGNGGLRLPDGRDADFNVFLGGRVELDAFVRATLDEAPSKRQEERDAIARDESDLITDAAIASYRRERIDHAV